MNETLNYIESYFSNTLDAAARQQFEEEITNNAAFAQEVAFYVQARQALRQQLLQQKEEAWKAEPTLEQPAKVIAINKPSFSTRWMAAAAVVVVAVGAYLLSFMLNSRNDATHMAQQYSDSAFGQLSHLMDASQDSLQQGIAAYNAGKWQEAENLFNAVYTAHPKTVDALKYSGIVSIKKKDYDKAIKQFEQLVTTPDLYANPGLFYQAIALLMRNEKDDKKQAATLLQQVVNGNLFGSAKAAEILQQINQ